MEEINIDNIFDETKNQILQTYQNMSNDLKNDLKKVKQIQDIMADMITLKRLNEVQQKARGDAEMQTTLEEYDRVLNSELQKNENRKINPKNQKEYKEFNADLKKILNQPENENEATTSNRVVCDDFVMEGDINITDPLTKKPIKNPVRNRHCHHLYDKDSMLESIKINRKLRCPFGGCGNKAHIVPDDLIEDAQMKQYIMNLEINNSSMDPLAV